MKFIGDVGEPELRSSASASTKNLPSPRTLGFTKERAGDDLELLNGSMADLAKKKQTRDGRSENLQSAGHRYRSSLVLGFAYERLGMTNLLKIKNVRVSECLLESK